jgi:hypothetical protein
MKWKLDLTALLVIGVVVLVVLDRCHGTNTGPKLDPKTTRTIDSLDRTAPEFRDRRDTVLLRAAKETVTAVRYVAASSDAERRARVSQRQADSLAAVGTVWKEAYESRTDEAVELRSTVALKDSAWRSERSSRISFQTLYAEDTLRRRATERVNASILRDVAKLERPCRIGPLPCPDRRAVAIGSFVLGAVAASRVAP